MAPSWLISIDAKGMRVLPSFLDRLRAGEARALRQLANTDLTALYRRGYTKLKKEQREGGLFWTEEVPAFVLIPFIRGGPHPQAAWIDDYVTLTDQPKSKRQWKKSLSFAKSLGRGMAPDENLLIRINANKVTAVKMKPNPKFELVVVNKHDRAALLKLLGEVDATANVAKWLAERTKQKGATQLTPLYEDYQSWCEQHRETDAGKKTFSQTLVAEGVVKLTRGSSGVRYELTLNGAA